MTHLASFGSHFVAGPRYEAPAVGTYTGAELRPFEGRPGANQALALPSRFGNLLHYRDGRIAPVEGMSTPKAPL